MPEKMEESQEGSIDYRTVTDGPEKSNESLSDEVNSTADTINGAADDTVDTVDDTFEDTVDDTVTDKESDDEDEPPLLKYSRFNYLLGNFFTKDPISTCTFHETVFIFATHTGIIHMTKTDFTPIRTFKAHKASVLSLYTDGLFFASGSMDGTIVIGSIEDEKDISAFDFKRPIHAVVLDKHYAKTRSFTSGGMSGKVLHSFKNWLGQRSDIVLDQDNGPIVSLQAIDDLILWMNDKGISVYHTTSRQIIKVIDKPENSPRSDLYWPRVHFPEVDRILVAWANHIWSLRASLKTGSESNGKLVGSGKSILPPPSMSFRTVQEKKIEVEHVFKLDDLISGISSFKHDLWMILTFNTPEIEQDSGKLVYNNPDLKLINPVTGEIVHEEEIGLKNVDGLGLNDYFLGSHIGDTSRYFIISAKDGVVAEETQLGDRLQWFVERQQYYEAWDISRHLVLPIKRINYGILHVDSLVKYDKWEEAANFLSRLLELNDHDLPGSDTKSTIITNVSTTLQGEEDERYVKEVVSQWTIWADIFIKSEHITELTEIIATNPKLNLPHSIFTRILEYWVSHDSQKFCALVNAWDIDLYDVKQIESQLETILENDSSNVELRKTLADLYVKSFEPSKAVPHLKLAKDPSLVLFLSEHHLLSNFVDLIPEFISLRFRNNELHTLPISDLQEKLTDVVDVLVENRHEIAPSKILKLMFDHQMDFMNYFYLQKLVSIDEFLTNSFGNERILVYSRYNRSLLLPFLNKSDNYDIDAAIKLCEENNFTEELVYLLGKIGEHKRALSLIINELDDPQIAIKFVKHQNDKETWNYLLDYSITKPNFIKALIECADDQSNSYYTPIDILQKMPSNLQIEGLRDSITKISKSHDINLVLSQIILKIVYAQSGEASDNYRLGRLAGYEIDVDDGAIAELIAKYETMLMYEKPDHEKSKDPTIIGESQLLNESKLHLTNVTFSSLPDKLDHLAIVNEIVENS